MRDGEARAGEAMTTDVPDDDSAMRGCQVRRWCAMTSQVNVCMCMRRHDVDDVVATSSQRSSFVCPTLIGINIPTGRCCSSVQDESECWLH